MSDRNNDQELEKTTDATADEVTSETETNDAIESVPADSMQFSVTFDDVDDEGTVDDGIYSALALSLITHLRAHETDSYLVCRLLLEKKKTQLRA